MSLVDATDLAKHFRLRGEDRPLVAVGGITFSIESGETFALVGESGSGKTTVGRMIVGLETPTAGSLTFQGREIGSLGRRDRRQLSRDVQIVFQDPGDSLNPRMTIADLVAEPLAFDRLSREKRSERVAASLLRVNLPLGVAHRFPHELSSGAQQKVALARALVGDPKLVVLDEATSALDVHARQELLRIVRSLQTDAGLATLFISHDLAAVRGLADRLAVMYLGEIVETGQTDEIFSTPSHPYTKALLASVPQPDLTAPSVRERTRLRGEIPSPIDLPRGCYLRSRCPMAVGPCEAIHPHLAPSASGQEVACIREHADPVPEVRALAVGSAVAEPDRRSDIG